VRKYLYCLWFGLQQLRYSKAYPWREDQFIYFYSCLCQKERARDSDSFPSNLIWQVHCTFLKAICWWNIWFAIQT
jgi:hypothetical protein